jgi:large subunit ribosomal protein L10
MPTPEKEAVVAEIKDRFTAADSVILADYRGLSVKDMQDLRAKLRESGGEMKIYKNRLTEIAVRELALPNMDELLQGPTAFVFAQGDPVAPSKALAAFAKEHDVLEIKGGLIENRLLEVGEIKTLAALPSREELLAKLLGTLQNPAAKTVRVLNGPGTAIARVLGAIADQKQAAA